MKKLLCILCALVAAPVHANWEKASYGDDGGRLTFAFRGGITMPAAKMMNDLGSMSVAYFTDGMYYYTTPVCDGGEICGYIGTVDIGALGVSKNYDTLTWAGGASIGMTIGNKPQLRLELDWLHIAESKYMASPLFQGTAPLDDGKEEEFGAGSAHASVSTDVISAMFYYDFFNGTAKRTGSTVPYVGFGLGYATNTTILALSDSYGDLSGSLVLDGLGDPTTVENTTILNFYTSETQTNNFALSAALGFSYGIDGGTFFDIGVRGSYVPKIRWALNNNGGQDAGATYKEHGIFSADNVIFTNIYAGLRFEF